MLIWIVVLGLFALGFYLVSRPKEAPKGRIIGTVTITTATATKGKIGAHVIRATPGRGGNAHRTRIEGSDAHRHTLDFQMVYVLKGSMTTELEGQGAITMKAGSCWIQPPRIKHKVLHYSDDCEVLEIVLPANFETVELT